MTNNQISYVEFRAKDLEIIKSFYQEAFGWRFKDYGPTYSSFSESGLYGGFEQSDAAIVNGALIVLYHDNLADAKKAVIDAGGTISKDIFSFPGGRRFQFLDPSGNELAVWSDK